MFIVGWIGISNQEYTYSLLYATFVYKMVYNVYLYARHLCSRDALGLKAAGRPSATIGYLVYKMFIKAHIKLHAFVW